MEFATVGTSWITSKFIDASKKVNGIKYLAVYSRTEEKASKFKEKHGAEYIFTDLDDMAKDDKIDIVYIASPNSLHFEHVIKFLKNKKHVICEKPIFSNINQFVEAYKVAKENDVYLFEAFKNIHLPAFKKLKEEINTIGDISSAYFHRVRYSSKMDEYLSGNIPNVFLPKFSGGAIVDLGVYPIALAVSLFGKPKSINYFPILLKTGVDGSGTLVLKYDKLICTIMCSKTATSFRDSEIHGGNGTISINDVGSLSNIEKIDRKNKAVNMINDIDYENNMKFEIEEFIRIIKERDNERYDGLKEISQNVLSITEEARKQNNIIFYPPISK